MTNKGTPAARDIAGTVLAVLFIGLLIAASFWILRPFLTSIVWATMIVVAHGNPHTFMVLYGNAEEEV